MEESRHRRALTGSDMRRMRIPKRYWSVTFDDISESVIDGKSAKDLARDYILSASENVANGVGLMLWGPNGTGKTSMAVVIAKELRRQFHAVLFVQASALRGSVISNEMFDDQETLWQRACSVAVLVIDDLGKGTQDKTGFGERMIDDLIRARNSNQLVTIITTNMSVKGENNALSTSLKASTMHSLKEHVVPVRVAGGNKRVKARIQVESENRV